MSSQSANVIDLQSYRALRDGEKQAAAPKPAASPAPDVVMIAWMPVWFMPVMWLGMPVAAR